MNAKPSVVTLEDKLQSRLGHDGLGYGQRRAEHSAVEFEGTCWRSPVAGLSLHVHDRDAEQPGGLVEVEDRVGKISVVRIPAKPPRTNSGSSPGAVA